MLPAQCLKPGGAVDARLLLGGADQSASDGTVAPLRAKARVLARRIEADDLGVHAMEGRHHDDMQEAVGAARFIGRQMQGDQGAGGAAAPEDDLVFDGGLVEGLGEGGAGVQCIVLAAFRRHAHHRPKRAARRSLAPKEEVYAAYRSAA
jgi:hypothetical protein